MHKHPDADAFMRACLDNSTDTTTRLVFADWLEDTGIPHNTAWAHFIRAKIEADQHPRDSAERRALEHQAEKCELFIRAKLVIDANTLVAHHELLSQLLPLHHITVRIGGFRPRAIDAVMVVEDLARRFPVLPLVLTRTMLIVATAELSNTTADLGHLLGVKTRCVVASRAEIVRALNDVYPIAPANISSTIA